MAAIHTLGRIAKAGIVVEELEPVAEHPTRELDPERPATVGVCEHDAVEGRREHHLTALQAGDEDLHWRRHVEYHPPPLAATLQPGVCDVHIVGYYPDWHIGLSPCREQLPDQHPGVPEDRWAADACFAENGRR
jgi:hypothetical protein